ncbi:hypothetical protein BDV93DRAFT_507756 [Ceratobasidium sp. AG-I]|nr:hypothetical protein BDV93DRAFT_507756 [Ceratobasidium sp. AG-I]
MLSQSSSAPLFLSNDDNIASPGNFQYAIAGSRLAKWARETSNLSVVSKGSRVPVQSHKPTPYTQVSSTRSLTPSELVFNSESLAPSQSSTIKWHKKTVLKRQNKDANVELGNNFNCVVLVYEDNGSVKYHAFECTKCNNSANSDFAPVCSGGLGSTPEQTHVLRRLCLSNKPLEHMLPIHRHVGIMVTYELSSHNKKCTGFTNISQKLDALGVTGGTKKLTPEQVHEYVGLWMAECVRPFQMINDYFDIKHMYEATQYNVIDRLVKHIGVFHIALGLFQSSNGNNFLGIVMFLFAGKADALAEFIELGFPTVGNADCMTHLIHVSVTVSETVTDYLPDRNYLSLACCWAVRLSSPLCSYEEAVYESDSYMSESDMDLSE